MTFWAACRSAAGSAPLAFDPRPLEAYLDFAGDPTPLIRRGLAGIPVPEWRHGDSAVTRLFRLDQATHCFHVAPYQWAGFHEPQITGGFVNFLNSGTAARRQARALALARAAASCAGKELDDSSVRTVRCVAEENRTDILVELHGGPQPFGVSIEAKFGHQLTRGQLPKALEHVQDRSWKLEKSILLVVSPDPRDLSSAILGQNRKHGWSATSWWALLIELERHTDPEHDCEDYRRFRRTVWHRAY
ncbi:MAG: hypothetical protein ACK4SZ_02930 [Allosphingosinicella sp.]|uniref:PD-(D/E)XK nuclease family protein n=1 Tax=Allosphingosinicella sp. TaxID=2823234 RepID=UPI00392840B5